MKKTLSTSEHYTWGNNCDGWHLQKREDMSVIQERMPPGAFEQIHFHEKSRQFFYILKGTATFFVGSEKIILKPQEGIEIEPGALHQVRNDDKEDLEFILFSSPSTHNDRVNT